MNDSDGQGRFKRYGRTALVYGGLAVGTTLEAAGLLANDQFWPLLTRYGIDKGTHAWFNLGLTGISDSGVDRISRGSAEEIDRLEARTADSHTSRYLQQFGDAVEDPTALRYAGTSVALITAFTLVSEGYAPSPEMLDPVVDAQPDMYDSAANYVPLLRYADPVERIDQAYTRARDSIG